MSDFNKWTYKNDLGVEPLSSFSKSSFYDKYLVYREMIYVLNSLNIISVATTTRVSMAILSRESSKWYKSGAW